MIDDDAVVTAALLADHGLAPSPAELAVLVAARPVLRRAVQRLHEVPLGPDDAPAAPW